MPQSQDLCAKQTPSGPLITADSIGVLAFRLTLGQLRRLCPSSKDTVMYGEESVSPAVRFRLGAVTVVASQDLPPNDQLHPNDPLDFWIIAGAQARLPLRAPPSPTVGAGRRRLTCTNTACSLYT